MTILVNGVPDTRQVNSYPLTNNISLTKADVGLSDVNNWVATSSTNDASNEKYTTAGAVKVTYDLASRKLDANANAVSASKLQTARLIAGVPFDGTSNITLNAGNVGALPITGGNIDGYIVVRDWMGVKGEIFQDEKPNTNYGSSLLSKATTDSKNYLRKFRSSGPVTIWHETVEADVYRLATGSTDAIEQLRLMSTGELTIGSLVANKGSIVCQTSGNDARVLRLHNAATTAGPSILQLALHGNGNMDIATSDGTNWYYPFTFSRSNHNVVANGNLAVSGDLSANQIGTGGGVACGSLAVGGGGTFGGSLVVSGTNIIMKSDGRRHLQFAQSSGVSDMYIWKDVGGDGIHITNAADGDDNWIFKKDGTLACPGQITVGGSTIGTNGDVYGTAYGGWLSNKLTTIQNAASQAIGAITQINNIGSMCWAMTWQTRITYGGVVSGANLRPCGMEYSSSGVLVWENMSLPGNWRCLGSAPTSVATLFVRVS